jgi:hypothetical protein
MPHWPRPASRAAISRPIGLNMPNHITECVLLPRNEKHEKQTPSMTVRTQSPIPLIRPPTRSSFLFANKICYDILKPRSPGNAITEYHFWRASMPYVIDTSYSDNLLQRPRILHDDFPVASGNVKFLEIILRDQIQLSLQEPVTTSFCTHHQVSFTADTIGTSANYFISPTRSLHL